jgi:hypothetical protein
MKRISIAALAALLIAGPAGAKDASCINWVKLMDTAIKAKPPANFMTHVIDEKLVDEYAKRLSVIANKALVQCSAELSPQ